jgi:hypothetical protein
MERHIPEPKQRMNEARVAILFIGLPFRLYDFFIRPQ